MVPSSWSEGQTDWKYIKHINRKFGTKSLKTFPHYRYWHKTIYYPRIKKLELISPLNWIEYNKFEAIEFMQKELGWASYGGKHHESVLYQVSTKATSCPGNSRPTNAGPTCRA